MTESPTAPVMHLAGVRKSYGKFEALKGIDLDIPRSEVVGLLGPNGAGKSTLFQIAAGLFAPDAGTVELFGLDYKRHGAEILSRLGVVFQSRSLDLAIEGVALQDRCNRGRRRVATEDVGDTFLAGEHRAPWREAAAAIVAGAEDFRAGRVGGGLHQRVPRRWA